MHTRQWFNPKKFKFLKKRLSFANNKEAGTATKTQSFQFEEQNMRPHVILTKQIP